MVFETAFWHWFSARQPEWKAATQAKYRSVANLSILPFWGGKETRDVTQRQIDLFRSKLGERRLSSSSESLALILLKKFLRESDRVPKRCASLRIKGPLVVHRERPLLTHDEERILISALRRRLSFSTVSFGILLAMMTGLRIGELCALRAGDFDLVTGTFRVRRTYHRVQRTDSPPGAPRTALLEEIPKTRHSVRTIPIPNVLRARYARLYGGSPDFLILTGNGKHMEPRALQHRFRSFLEDNGLRPVCFHSLRHAFATRAVEHGVDLKSLSEVLGHSKVQTTASIYVHPSMELKRFWMERLSLSISKPETRAQAQSSGLQRKSRAPTISTPASLFHGSRFSAVTIILRKESSTRRSEACSCSSFSLSGMASADCT